MPGPCWAKPRADSRLLASDDSGLAKGHRSHAVAFLFLASAQRFAQCGSQIVSASYWIVIIRRNFLKAQISVEPTGGFHLVQGVEQDMVVGVQMGCVQDGFGQLPAQTQPSKCRAHIQALHLASVGIIGAVQGTQGTAASQLAVHQGQQQGPPWRGIVAGQGREFLLKTLETQIDVEAGGVLAENLAHGVEFSRLLGRQDRDGGRVQGKDD